MDIWLVTYGEYSSYTVIAAFTTMEAADTYADVMNRSNEEHYYTYQVERVDLDPPLPALVAPRAANIIEQAVVEDAVAVAKLKQRLEAEKQERESFVESLVLDASQLKGLAIVVAATHAVMATQDEEMDFWPRRKQENTPQS